MAKNSKIEWTQHTWNPWQGCHKVSAGCKNCYMFREKIRYGQNPNVVIRSKDATFNAPLKWRDPAFVFTCSWSDFFIEEADPWRAEAWRIIKETPHLTYQILTKRPQFIADRLPNDWGFGYRNVWIGISAEDQKAAYERIPILLDIPSAFHWISAEPLLGHIDFSAFPPFCFPKIPDAEKAAIKIIWPNGLPKNSLNASLIRKISLIVTGGESGLGQNYRSSNPDWFRSIRDQCLEYGVPFFHKQNGGNKKINGAWGGRELDGRTWDEMPI